MRLQAAIPIVLVSTVALGAPSAVPSSSTGVSDPSSLEAPPIPSTETPKPTTAEWEIAPPIALKWTMGCHAQMTREWIRVWCPGSPVRVAVIDGDRNDVVFSTGLAPAHDETGTPKTRRAGVMVAFPLRRGMRTAMQLWTTVEDVEPDEKDHGIVRLVSAYWLEDEPRPMVTIQ